MKLLGRECYLLPKAAPPAWPEAACLAALRWAISLALASSCFFSCCALHLAAAFAVNVGEVNELLAEVYPGEDDDDEDEDSEEVEVAPSDEPVRVRRG